MSTAKEKELLKENGNIHIIKVWILDGIATEDLIEKLTFEKRYEGRAITLWPHPEFL